VRVSARLLIPVLSLVLSTAAVGQQPTADSRGDSVTISLVEVELRVAVQMLGQFLDRPVIFGAIPSQTVSVESPRPVPRSQVLELLRSLLDNQGFDLLDDSAAGLWRVRARERSQAQSQAQGVPRPAGYPELFVIRLSHARASDVAATVNALYGRPSALGEPAAVQTLPDALRQNLVAPGVPPLQAAPGAAGRVAALQGEVTIVPDAGTNSLLIRASRTDFQLIEAAVAELDVRPLQVLIEVLIAELRSDRSWSFGVGTVQGSTRVGGGTTVSGSVEGAGLGDLVIQVMNIGGGDLHSTLRASAARGDATILSRPVVLAANNERAMITVGSQRPFIQVSRSLPTDAPSRDQVVQYRDVGTSLAVRPTISGNGYVTLEVTQEVNAATSETAFDAPVISTRSVRTQLLVRDGQTVILGGLSDNQREETRGGVPLLSSLPLVGGLFGRRSGRTTATELFLFLTPRILRTDEEADAVTRERRERTPGVEP
jgi:general secretion pathway protein D